MNADWKCQNELIFAQPSNLRFVRGTAPRPAAAIEVYAPRKPGIDSVVLAAVVVAVTLGLYFA